MDGHILLAKLADGLPAITPEFGAAIAQAAAVCLEERKHKSGTEIKGIIQDDELSQNFLYKVYWQEVTPQMRRCWNDREVTTEHGAYAISFLLIQELTDYTVIERSYKGTGFDYWLGTQADEKDLPFQNKARLEVSGIRNGDLNKVNARMRTKLKQVNLSQGLGLPAYIVVVEFSLPFSQMVVKNGQH